MELATAIRAVLATLRRRPADLLPLYLLNLAIPAIIRVVSFAGLFALVGYFVTSGRLETIRTEVQTVDLEPPDPEAEPDAFVAWAESLQPLVETMVTPTTIVLVGLTVLFTVVAAVVLTAAVSAGQLAACHARLQQQRGLVRGIAGLRAYWVRFLGIYLLELFLWLLVTGVTAGVIALAFLISPVLGIFVAIFAILFWIAVAIAIRAIFVFAPIAIVVDDEGVFASLASSLGFIRAEFMNAVSYYVISVALLMGYAGVASTMGFIGAPSIAPLVSLLLVVPALDLLKTVLFGDHRGTVRPPEQPESGLLSQARDGIERGLGETARFVRETPGLHALSLGSMVVGFATGWIVSAPLVGVVDASISARLVGWIPPIEALNLFGNNWTVTFSLAYSGVVAGIPAIVGVWFNGVLFGATARLEVAILELAAFVIPHGIIEIPSVVIAGATGVYLGIATWRTWRGHTDRRSLAHALERAFWVLIGVGVLLAVAALIEGFVSPYYWRLFL